jgi:hypothetical protein
MFLQKDFRMPFDSCHTIQDNLCPVDLRYHSINLGSSLSNAKADKLRPRR